MPTVERIRSIFFNLQHLINTFRPYQAREDLIEILQSQIDKKRALVERLKAHCVECAKDGDSGDGRGAPADAGADGSGTSAAAAADSTERNDDTVEIDADADSIAWRVAVSDARAEVQKMLDSFPAPANNP